MNGQSAVEFATPTRVHIGLSVRDAERSATFYRHLFAQEPTKVRPGYVKFEVADPPVNLTLNTDAERQTRPGPSAHFGVQVKSTETVARIAAQLQVAGLNPYLEEAVSCCYAVQDKAWVTDPDGNAWEIFVVLDADGPDYARKKRTSGGTEAGEALQSTTCCTTECCPE
jgi:catechol 2,3-dioxygenase-like lactoylglutathione lyase family enzyme